MNENEISEVGLIGRLNRQNPRLLNSPPPFALRVGSMSAERVPKRGERPAQGARKPVISARRKRDALNRLITLS